jgi:hypothetical protein
MCRAACSQSPSPMLRRRNDAARSPPLSPGGIALESEGKADKAEGKVQNAIGGLKDVVRDAVKK